MKAIKSKLIIKIEKQYTDSVRFMGGDLYKDPMYNRTWNLMYCGVVMGIPDEGAMLYSHAFNREVCADILVGDKVYFHYVHSDTDSGDVLERVEGGLSVTKSIPYGDAICVVRDGVIIPVGGWCLGETLIMGDGEIEEIETSTGKKKIRVEYISKALNLVASHNEEVYDDRCVVKYISNYKDEIAEFGIGDIVVGKGINFKNTIEGEEYYCFQHDTVLAIL